MPESSTIWRILVDAGGTFTDCLALDPGGRLHRAKVLSSSAIRAVVQERLNACVFRVSGPGCATPGFLTGMIVRNADASPLARIISHDPHDPDQSYGSPGVIRLDKDIPLAPGRPIEIAGSQEAPTLAFRLIVGSPESEPLPPAETILATTRGTNALLERKGAPVALFVTEGFADLLEIGTQQRPDLFALDIRKPPLLHAVSIEVPGRLAADGSVVRALDFAAVEAGAASARCAGCRAAAVSLMHAWINPEHEREVERILRCAGFEHVSVSSSLSPTIGYLQRTQTAVVNAFLSPVLDDYLTRIDRANPAGRLRVLTSAGSLRHRAEFHAKDSLLSGPAGGVAGAAHAARRCGFTRIISFDMGGTSTDAARYDGRHAYEFEHGVAGASIAAPALAIRTVAAGGGSICRFDRGLLAVGPASAGADPGPACYGRGGPLTITDANLLLGRIDPETMSVPVDMDAAREAAARLARDAGRDDLEQMLRDLLDIANETMADAIRQVSVREGYSPADYALVAFGGAGGQHACAVARRLGITSVIVPPDAGLLSAAGLAAAAPERFAQRQVLRPLREIDLPSLVAAIERDARAELARDLRPGESVRSIRRILSLRLAGQHGAIAVEWSPGDDAESLFQSRYRAQYHHNPPRRPVEVESIRVVATGPPAAELNLSPCTNASSTRADNSMNGRIPRASLHPGAVVTGPLLITEPHAATYLEDGWRAEVHESGALLLHDAVGAPASDSISIEIFQARLESIAREMGEMLRRTALSTNVKERLDYSCALLDAGGRLVVNAPHVPVHLGALGLCVREVARRIDMRPGDAVVTNHPAFGGSHLPDITVITPIHDHDGALLAYAATRAHHAEIGGLVPGSMAPEAACLADEGCVIPPMHLSRAGESCIDAVLDILKSSPHPSRRIDENAADLLAAEAACAHARTRLLELAAEIGPARIRDGMEEILSRSEQLLADAIKRLPPGDREATDALDDGSAISARASIRGGRLVITLTGPPKHHPGSYNAPLAVTRSVLIYVLRLLVARPIPLNEGLLRNVEINVSPGMLNPRFDDDPRHSPAVAAGNVETSQRIADVLIRLFDLAACSQGTMNNVVMGNDDFSFYETICGGAGAGPDFDGASAVHTHMTNTRVTDAEIIEHRCPLRVERFAIRRDSGGPGLHRGGDGVTREISFLSPASLAVIAQRRTIPPPGAHGGRPGSPGAQSLLRPDGSILNPDRTTRAAPGDRLIIHTPGGGGWGESP